MCRLMGSGESIYQGMELWFGQKERNSKVVCWRMDGTVSNADVYWIEKKPNATSPKSVKWVDDALQKADR